MAYNILGALCACHSRRSWS